MKKIGIVTILKVNNYGAELQAFATQFALKRMGYQAEIIDYLFYKNRGFRPTKRSAPLFDFSWKKRLAEKLYPVIERIKGLPYRKARKRREKRFDSFHRENTSFSEQFRTIDALYDTDLGYDVYLTGSDQVWNPGIYSSLAPYFLDFAPKGARRIAYAASFGVSQIPEYARERYREFLSCYNAIGVREKTAVGMVRDIAGKDAQWVLDPTFLLTRGEWSKVARPVDLPAEKFILIYELTPCAYIRRLAEHLREKTGMPIVRICKSAAKESRDSQTTDIVDAGPAEFLYLFSKATAIVTNSFHGTAFSINFGKPFYTITPQRKANNSRQRSLLELFGLQNRLLEEDAPFLDIADLPIDYIAVNQTLESERAKSISFLKNAID